MAGCKIVRQYWGGTNDPWWFGGYWSPCAGSYDVSGITITSWFYSNTVVNSRDDSRSVTFGSIPNWNSDAYGRICVQYWDNFAC